MSGVDPHGPDVQRIDSESFTWCVRGSKEGWYIVTIEGYGSGQQFIGCDCKGCYLGRRACRHIKMVLDTLTPDDLRTVNLDRLVVA